MVRVRLKAQLFTLLGVALVIGISLPGTSQAPTPAPPPPLLLGTAWYPEQWPESRWEDDLTLMEQAGIHMVRVG